MGAAVRVAAELGQRPHLGPELLEGCFVAYRQFRGALNQFGNGFGAVIDFLLALIAAIRALQGVLMATLCQFMPLGLPTPVRRPAPGSPSVVQR